MSDRHSREADMKTNIVRLLAENAELKRERDEAREQRDRLAEAIRKHKFCDVALYEALQSLKQPTL